MAEMRLSVPDSGGSAQQSPREATTAMTEQIDPVKTLKAARYKLVQERRGLAVAMALGHRRRRTDSPQTNEMREAFALLQNTIEAVERAIAHEQLIKDEPVEIFTLPTPEAAPAAPILEPAPATVPV
jgi:hypothetical protein